LESGDLFKFHQQSNTTLAGLSNSGGAGKATGLPDREQVWRAATAWVSLLAVTWVIRSREIPRCTIGNRLYSALVLIDLTKEFP
jgi:hypothetical protein